MSRPRRLNPTCHLKIRFAGGSISFTAILLNRRTYWKEAGKAWDKKVETFLDRKDGILAGRK